MAKFNKSRRSVANERLNAFLNQKYVGIKAVNISEAGNIEIKFIAWHISSAQLKLRVNLTTLTYVFEMYGSRYQQGVQATMSKRKAIDTSPIGDKNFFQTELLAFIDENRLDTGRLSNDLFKELYMVDWGVIAPEPLPEPPATSKDFNAKYDAMQQAHVMYAKMAVDNVGVRSAAMDERYAEITGRQLDLAKLQHVRDNTPLFTDDEFDMLLSGKPNEYRVLSAEHSESYPNLEIDEQQTVTGDVVHIVKHEKDE